MMSKGGRMLGPRLLNAASVAASAFALAGLLAACAGWGIGQDDAPAGLGCVDDTFQCVDQRRAALKTLLDDKQNGWVKQAPTPQAYASGVRLFALKQKKRELTCD